MLGGGVVYQTEPMRNETTFTSLWLIDFYSFASVLLAHLSVTRSVPYKLGDKINDERKFENDRNDEPTP